MLATRKSSAPSPRPRERLAEITRLVDGLVEATHPFQHTQPVEAERHRLVGLAPAQGGAASDVQDLECLVEAPHVLERLDLDAR